MQPRFLKSELISREAVGDTGPARFKVTFAVDRYGEAGLGFSHVAESTPLRGGQTHVTFGATVEELTAMFDSALAYIRPARSGAEHALKQQVDYWREQYEKVSSLFSTSLADRDARIEKLSAQAALFNTNLDERDKRIAALERELREEREKRVDLTRREKSRLRDEGWLQSLQARAKMVQYMPPGTIVGIPLYAPAVRLLKSGSMVYPDICESIRQIHLFTTLVDSSITVPVNDALALAEAVWAYESAPAESDKSALVLKIQTRAQQALESGLKPVYDSVRSDYVLGTPTPLALPTPPALESPTATFFAGYDFLTWSKTLDALRAATGRQNPLEAANELQVIRETQREMLGGLLDKKQALESKLRQATQKEFFHGYTEETWGKVLQGLRALPQEAPFNLTRPDHIVEKLARRLPALVSKNAELESVNKKLASELADAKGLNPNIHPAAAVMDAKIMAGKPGEFAEVDTSAIEFRLLVSEQARRDKMSEPLRTMLEKAARAIAEIDWEGTASSRSVDDAYHEQAQYLFDLGGKLNSMSTTEAAEGLFDIDAKHGRNLAATWAQLTNDQRNRYLAQVHAFTKMVKFI